MSLKDSRWSRLEGGYRLPYDPRPALEKLKFTPDDSASWDELWQELHHQGDVGEASYAAVPELVRLRGESGTAVSSNVYALVGVIELARTQSGNPPVPPWLRETYDSAVAALARMALEELPSASNGETVRSALGVISLWKNERAHARILLEFNKNELEEIVDEVLGA